MINIAKLVEKKLNNLTKSYKSSTNALKFHKLLALR
jgi:hypothetical protein